MADASAFRGSSTVLMAMDTMKVEDVRMTMLDMLVPALGSGNRVTEERLARLEETLRPTFLAMPKNENGNLDHAGVRYVLHRLFVQRHGMYIKGLDPGSDTWKWNSSSPADILEDHVPTFVQDLFEERLKGRGLGMHEIAILAATLEHLIHNEAEGRLKKAYETKNISLEARLGVEETDEVRRVYMFHFLKGPQAVYNEEAVQTMRRIYPNWEESLAFLSKVQEEVMQANAADPAFAEGKLSFNGTSKVIEEFGERYGRWQNSECLDLKSALMRLENKNTGRVLLKDFHGSAKDGAWQFTESIDYLRALGDLDESDPENPSVLIANYVNSASNCLASSSMYSACCINECEDLLGHIEREVAAPEATPDSLAAIIEHLPSATVTAPWRLPEMLRKRLQEMADYHGGKVQLHGRLFAQLLHNAYPRECPYPHQSNTTTPMTAYDWIAEHGQDALTEDIWNMSQTHGASREQEPQILWSEEEELVVTRPSTPAKGTLGAWASIVRAVAQVAALLALAFGLKHQLVGGLAALHGTHGQKGGLPLTMSWGKAHTC
jgi:hypothetical protein